MSSTLNRRAILAGAAVPALTIPLAATTQETAAASIPVTHQDAELIQFGEQLKRAWSHERAMSAKWGYDECEQAKKECDAAHEACSKIVGAIENRVARTLEGLQVKALAILWCNCGEVDSFSGENTTDVRLMRSILLDLICQRMVV